MEVLYTGFKGINNSSYQLISKISGRKLFLTNSFKGLEKDIMNVTDQFDLVVMFGLDTSLKETVQKFDGKVIFIHIPSLKNMSEDMIDRIVKCMESEW